MLHIALITVRLADLYEQDGLLFGILEFGKERLVGRYGRRELSRRCLCIAQFAHQIYPIGTFLHLSADYVHRLFTLSVSKIGARFAQQAANVVRIRFVGLLEHRDRFFGFLLLQIEDTEFQHDGHGGWRLCQRGFQHRTGFVIFLLALQRSGLHHFSLDAVGLDSQHVVRVSNRRLDVASQ